MPKTFASSGLTNSQDRGQVVRSHTHRPWDFRSVVLVSHTPTTLIGSDVLKLCCCRIWWCRMSGGSGRSWKRGKYDQNAMHEILKKLIKNIFKKIENKKAKIKSAWSHWGLRVLFGFGFCLFCSFFWKIKQNKVGWVGVSGRGWEEPGRGAWPLYCMKSCSLNMWSESALHTTVLAVGTEQHRCGFVCLLLLLLHSVRLVKSHS